MALNRRWKAVAALVAVAGLATVAVRRRRRGSPANDAAADTGGIGGADEPTVAPAEPPAPDWAYDVINPVMERLLRSPLHGLVSDSLLLITSTGRRSGNEYTTPVGYRQAGDTLTVFTQSPWWKNLRGGQPVRVYLRGEERDAIAEPTAESDEVADRVRQFVAEEGVEKARRIGLRIEGDRLPDDEELAAGVEGLVAIDIELAE
ncbi:nitroreductase/quinone reductase family protein [Halorussus sp. AFM4]|uniref:nitroreductase/quinone reductase family protein n=1 Tax=Halorussus sp. AFM4 TaxID=3421651 RepID=UPI003EB6B866